MEEKLLKFMVKFRKKKNEQNKTVENNVKSLFLKLKEAIGNPDVLVEEAEFIRQDLVYSGDLHKISVTFQYGNMKPKKLCEFREKICRLWCAVTNKDSEPYWLVQQIDRYFSSRASFHYDLDTKEFSFGTFPDMCLFVPHYRYESAGKELLTSFYHTKKSFVMFMCLNHKNCFSWDCPINRFLVEYSSIHRIIINDTSEGNFIEIFFHLSHPPLVFREQTDHSNGDGADTEFVANSHESFLTKNFERALDFGCECNKSICSIKKIGRAPVFKIKFSGKLRAYEVIERLRHRCLNSTEFCYAKVRDLQSPADILQNQYEDIEFYDPCHVDVEPLEMQRFSCDYSWRMLFSRSLEVQDQILLQQYSSGSIRTNNWSFVRNGLLKYVNQNAEALSNTLVHISELVIGNAIFSFQQALAELFDHYSRSPRKVDLPNGMCMVRRVIITPSRTVFLPETESFDNRIIREFNNANEYMLRVSVQDDNFKKLTFAIQYNSQREVFMKEVVGYILLDGIKISNRHYEVLASSGSQLREHGIWLYTRDHAGRTAKDIRTWMGDFSHIKNVAKYMARMGQCFSTSDEAIQVNVPPEQVTRIHDVKSSDNTYTFSDGIGKISTELAEVIRKAKNDDKKQPVAGPQYKPSAFQIRFKGCKGMLAEDPTLRGFDMAIRPSMEKFKCANSDRLEIVKLSAPRQMYLNRPLITILEQLGVNPDVFMDMQKKMILDLTECLLYESKAADMLKSQTSLNIPFKALKDCGVFLTEEPFFRSLLLALYRNAVYKLKTKARIAVPPNLGRNMLGVLDETKTLNYGEVFVQYSEELGYNVSKTHILEGTIVVTKNPCMHPGDVRKLTAVDVPALHHIKDCVVFPAKGHRPHPDEMAGSDLDGDEYIVMWMPELIFQNDNYPPMEYPTSKERAMQDKIGVTEMVEFLCEYIQNDNIGTFAFAHLAWADKLDNGIYSDVCMKIASKYPYVLDFAKTGETQRLLRQERPASYPDFMEKGHVSDSYRSKRVLGHLYRFVKNLEACIDKADISEHQTIEPDKYLCYQGWEQYIQSAKMHKEEYVEKVSGLLKKYGIRSEAEAISGYVGGFKPEMQNRNDSSDAAIIVKTYLLNLMDRYKYIFLREVERESEESLSNAEQKRACKFRRASAWYMAFYEDVHSSQGILSMPWVLGDILAEVREECKQMEKHPVVTVSSSLLMALDYSLFGMYKLANIGRESCPCLTIAENVLIQWIVVSRLNPASCMSKRACVECFSRIFAFFLQNSGESCCSSVKDVEHPDDICCLCSIDCSPAKFIMAFLKFYLSNVTTLGTHCSICTGFRDLNLQSAALKTYVSVAVTRKVKQLGIELDTEFTIEQEMINEGDPVRVEVTDELYSLILKDLEEVSHILKVMSECQEVKISIDRERNGKPYMLASATGTSWQRLELEDLVMDTSLTEMLKSRLRNQPSR